MISKERLIEIKTEADKFKNLSLSEIAEQNKIKVLVIDLSEIWNGKISWAISKNKESDTYEYNIFIDSKTNKNRQRFTFAHELGHRFLHEDILKQKNLIIDEEGEYLFRDDCYDNISDGNKVLEEEANEFAGNLLMPEEKVRELWLKTQNIGLLAEAFDVSVAAMTYRIYKLNLK